MSNQEKIKYAMYLRKSTDSEDRQIQSIEDQKKELDKVVVRLGLEVSEIYQESKSAKEPGRPEFNRLIGDIRKGKMNGIICWKINRLSRNPMDGGEIQWLLQRGIIQSIQTPEREYKTVDNTIMMSVELGMATQYSLDLGRDVKRGTISKAEKGWRPGLAPIGYLNDKLQEKGKKEVHVDKNRFPLVRKMWDLMLTGNYTVPQIAGIVNDQWGLRTHYHKRETRLSTSHIYRIFTNPFYYGEFEYAGQIYQGKHKAMITPEEYDRVQKILGAKGKPRAKHKTLPFTGLIRCGECGCSITADEKHKYVKSKHEINSYIYHKCTKKKPGVKCDQKPASNKILEQQVFQALDSITIPESFLKFAIDCLNKENDKEVADRNILIKNQQSALDSCVKRLDNLLGLFISPENANRELLSDEEFKNQKLSLLKEKTGIQSELQRLDARIDEWIELSEKTFKFATYAKFWYTEGDYKTKTDILRALGSNFILKNLQLSLSLQKGYKIIENGNNEIIAEYPTLELATFNLDKAKTTQKRVVSTILSG